MSKIKELEKKRIKLQKEINDLVDKYGLNSKEVLNKSQELDRLTNQLQIYINNKKG